MMRFDLSKYKYVSVQSFTLEAMTGQDSLDAAARVIGPRSKDRNSELASMSAQEFNIAHRNALIAQAISHVNDKPVQQPFNEWSGWSLRTQEFVLNAYMRMNEAEKEEIDNFIKAHFDTPQEDSEPTSSGSGSTSHGI